MSRTDATRDLTEIGSSGGEPGGGQGGTLQGEAEVGGDKGRVFLEEEAQKQRVTEGKGRATGS